jgi:hypothetical protein
MSIPRPTLLEYALFISGIALVALGILTWGLPGSSVDSAQIISIIPGAVCIGFGWALQHRRFQSE